MKSSLKKRRFLVAIIIIVLVICLLNFFQKEVRSFFYWFSAPIQKVLWQEGERISDFFGTFVRTKNIGEEIKKLEEENQKLTAEIAFLKELKEENENLRKALNIGLQENFKLSFAEIIGKDISQDFILINKGAEDGISKNMPVATSDKILLGKIENVYENFSKVMLLSNKKFSFDVRIQNSEDIFGVGKGGGNSKILIDFVPREENVSKGEIVVSDSLGGIFPKGFLIGQVKTVEKNDIDISQKIEVTPAFNIKEISTLFVIIGY